MCQERGTAFPGNDENHYSAMSYDEVDACIGMDGRSSSQSISKCLNFAESLTSSEFAAGHVTAKTGRVCSVDDRAYVHRPRNPP